MIERIHESDLDSQRGFPTNLNEVITEIAEDHDFNSVSPAELHPIEPEIKTLSGPRKLTEIVEDHDFNSVSSTLLHSIELEIKTLFGPCKLEINSDTEKQTKLL